METEQQQNLLLKPVTSVLDGVRQLWVLARDIKTLLTRQNELLEKNNELLEQLLAKEIAPPEETAPNFKFPLADYKDFDWERIGAKEIARDGDGATIVEWRDRTFERRRSGIDDIKGVAIWFSSPTKEKRSDGKVKYLHLITFSQKTGVRPLHGEIKEHLA